MISNSENISISMSPLGFDGNGNWKFPDKTDSNGLGRIIEPSDTACDVLTARECAALLRINIKTLYEAVQRRQLPALRLGKRLVFSRQAVLERLGQPCVLPRR